MTPAVLSVFYGRRLVGRITSTDAGMAFAYEPSWRTAPDAFAISLSLPLDGELDDRRATRFFANLLPEANVRTLVCRRLGISEGNDFALLAAIGGECAGALSIVPMASSRSSPRRSTTCCLGRSWQSSHHGTKHCRPWMEPAAHVCRSRAHRTSYR